MSHSTKTLIYDDACPLCRGYSKVFVNAGLIETEGRKSFDSAQPAFLEIVDLERSVDEIPFVDLSTKKVWYGVDALLEIVGSRFSLVKKCGHLRPVKWLLWKAYRLISYNRRLILAVNSNPTGYDCAPTFNLRYRVAFLAIFLVINTILLIPLHRFVLQAGFFSHTSLPGVVGVHSAVVLVNCMVAILLGERHGTIYLGQINMLAVSCLLLFMPLVLFNMLTGYCNADINDGVALAIFFLMLREYRRRMKYAEILTAYPLVAIVNAISILAMLQFLLSN
ncbi:MAG: hypothetical protein Q7T76_12695 [Ferruginibacter sp.]|nr:hypothetical protein [Ferruginibacter sp.]